MVHGAEVGGMVRYTIDYSLDIRGNITIWSGMDYLPEEAIVGIDSKQRVGRRLRPVYEYEQCHPCTARIYQMEKELDPTISDDKLIEAYQSFRQDHPSDGYGLRLLILNIGLVGVGSNHRELTEEEKYLTSLRPERDDKQEVLDRLLKQERRDILNLWGIDCPPDINLGENYQSRLMQDRGMTSEWFKREFERIGGDWDKLWRRG